MVDRATWNYPEVPEEPEWSSKWVVTAVPVLTVANSWLIKSEQRHCGCSWDDPNEACLMKCAHLAPSYLARERLKRIAKSETSQHSGLCWIICAYLSYLCEFDHEFIQPKQPYVMVLCLVVSCIWFPCPLVFVSLCLSVFSSPLVTSPGLLPPLSPHPFLVSSLVFVYLA